MKIKFNQSHSLSEKDQATIVFMAEALELQKREYFVNNIKMDKKMLFLDMNKNGFGAELSFCRMSNLPFDDSTKEEENHFRKPDCILPNGWSVDVKNTTYTSGSLITWIGKEVAGANIYVLMVGSFPTFTFKGWATSEMLIKKENIKNVGHGDGYWLSQKELIKDLEF